MNNLENHKKIILIIILVVLSIGGYYIYNNFEYNKNNQEDIIENDILVSENKTNLDNVEEKEDTSKIIVHISGEVINPGVIELKEGERIFNAIEKAGGTTKNADTSKINLAQIVEDGMKINVPNINDKPEREEYIFTETGNNKEKNLNEGSKKVMVNINTATQTELETLPGIGPSIASKIINYRKEKGKFSKIEDIKNVNGIGDAKFKKIKEFICVK